MRSFIHPCHSELSTSQLQDGVLEEEEGLDTAEMEVEQGLDSSQLQG